MQFRAGPSLWLLVAVFASGLLACGTADRGSVASPGEPSAPAAESGATTARFRMVGPSGEQVGVVDLPTGEHRVRSTPGPDNPDPLTELVVGGNRFRGRPEWPSGPRWIVYPLHETDPAAGRYQLDPIAVIDDLRASSTTVEELGSGRVRGEPTAAFRLTLQPGAEVPGMLLPSRLVPEVMTIDVDAEGRLRRAIAEDRTTTAVWTTEVELWDFGVSAELVAPDPADVVGHDDPRSVRILAGVGPDGRRSGTSDALMGYLLTGSFAKVAEGQWEHVTWEVWAAPAVRDETCRTFELDPLPAVDLNGVVHTAAVHRNGVTATCALAPGVTGDQRPVEVLSFGLGSDPWYWYLAGYAAPGIEELEFEMEDGSVLSVPVDARSGLFTLFDTDLRPIAEIRGQTGEASVRCAVEGDDVDEWFPIVMCSTDHG